jgi:hypothetical protein
VISISGFAIPAIITPKLLTSNFNSLGKVYNRNSYAPVNYSLSGFFEYNKLVLYKKNW